MRDVPWKRLGFQPGLEGLRGVAVLIVCGTHVAEFLLPQTSGWLFPGGFYSVDLFFALSGFLITAILISNIGRHGKIGYRRFVARRMQRLYPAIVLFCVGHFVYAWVAGDTIWNPKSGIVQGELANLGWIATYAANLQLSFGIQPRLDLVHLWTLGVEMQFYLIWPFVFFGLARLVPSTKWLITAIGVLVVASCLIRYVEWRVLAENPFWPHLIYERTEARADSILCGAIVAVLWSRDLLKPAILRFLGPCAALALAIGIMVVELDNPLIYKGGLTLGGIAAAVMVADVVGEGSALGAVLSWSPFRIVGRASYSLYLWHLPVIGWVNRYHGGLSTWPKVLLTISIAALVTGVTWWIAERPVLHLPSMKARSRTKKLSMEKVR